MKKFLWMLFFLGSPLMAAPLVIEAPIVRVGAGTTVALSTSAWTVVPTASTLGSRTGIKISNPSTNTGVVSCIMDTTTPTEAITVKPIEIQAGENPAIPVRVDILLYCVSHHTSTENVHVQEYSQ